MPPRPQTAAAAAVELVTVDKLVPTHHLVKHGLGTQFYSSKKSELFTFDKFVSKP